jgi:hypothetical protein
MIMDLDHLKHHAIYLTEELDKAKQDIEQKNSTILSFNQDDSTPDDYFDKSSEYHTVRQSRLSFHHGAKAVDQNLLCKTCSERVKSW